jgi:spoIIIJ-associated protein
MSQEKANLEIIAPTIEEATQNGLDQLGLTREEVDIEILDAGSRGLFGLGGRQARVRLTLIGSKETKVSRKTGAPKKRQPSQPAGNSKPVAQEPEPSHQNEPVQSVESDDPTIKVAVGVINDLLGHMKVNASVDAEYVEPEDERDRQILRININGNDLSILIGRRSETLNALQYIASLIINKQMGHSVPLMIDVQGYRSRREGQIRQLARRMADQALQTGRRQVLEPMPPNERRLLHLELRDHPDVYTESVGEGSSRKVTIRPKNQ